MQFTDDYEISGILRPHRTDTSTKIIRWKKRLSAGTNTEEKILEVRVDWIRIGEKIVEIVQDSIRFIEAVLQDITGLPTNTLRYSLLVAFLVCTLLLVIFLR